VDTMRPEAVLGGAPRAMERSPILLAVVLSVVVGVIPCASAHGDDGTGKGGQFFLLGVDDNLPASGPIMANKREGEGQPSLSTAGLPRAQPLLPELQSVDAPQQVEVGESGGVMPTGNVAGAKKLDRSHSGLDYLGVTILKDRGSKVLGMAAASIKGDEQGLALTVWGLQPDETYALVIDGTSMAGVAASAQGRIQVEYWSTPTGEELQLPDTLMSLSGVMHAELQDAGGTTVASGDFQTVLNPARSTIDRVVKRKVRR
jgi:hypothetical protein